MKNLQTARVCIIDDEPDEYLNLIHALSRIGLGCLHIDGTREEELPKPPLSGLRLVFLDMQLGTTGDENQITAHTANVFSRVVAQEGGPVLVVIWTKHNHYVEAFKSRLFEKWPGYLGRLVFTRMDKPIPKSNIDPLKLEATIRDQLEKNCPLDLVWQWEQSVHDAATDTTSALSQLAAKRAGVAITDDEPQMAEKVRAAFRFLLRVMLDATAGRNAREETALRDLLSGLATLHADRLEHNSSEGVVSSAPLLLRDKRPEPAATECAAINAMLLVAPVDADVASLCPGSLFTFTDAEAFKNTFGQEWLKIAEKAFDPNETKPEERSEFLKVCRPVLAEISADCDYAQRKRPVARLLTGVLVPAELASKLADNEKFGGAAYLRHGIVLTLQNPPGNWLPIYVSQFTFSVSPPNLPALLQPIGRLRSGPLTELRHWLAAHSTRPGYLSVK
jgi:hypothetical protein